MPPRRVFAVAVLILPALIGFWAYGTFHAGEATLAFAAPHSPEIAADEFSKLSREQLANVAYGAIEKHKRLDALRQMARDRNHDVVVTLLVMIGLLSVTLFAVFWRLPAGRADPEK